MDLIAPPEAAGERLDRFLAAHVGSRAQAQRLIELGLVWIDGRAARNNDRVQPGAAVLYEQPPAQTVVDAGPPAPYSIHYEDADVIVVDKPAGVVVHPAAGHRAGTLSQALAMRGAQGGETHRPGIVHRLDKDTSGLLVVAKGDEAHRRLKAALAAREVAREYIALVDGRPPARSGTIDAPLGRDRHVRRRVSIDTDHPREAITHFEVTEALPDATLLRVRLETGRTHQIRAHFTAIGHPIAGDPEYGRAGAYGLTRQFLHAHRLAFAQPFSGEALEFCSPLPSDLLTALDRARGSEGGVS